MLPLIWMNRNLDPFWSDFDRQVSRWFREPVSAALPSWNAPFDVERTDSHYLLSVDLPGVPREKIELSLENGLLKIQAERESRHSDNPGKRCELRFQVPEDVDGDKVEAVYENGVLRIALGRAETAKPRRVPIQEGKGGFFSRLVKGAEKIADGTRKAPGAAA